MIDILLIRANLNGSISQLQLWNDKKSNQKVQEMIKHLQGSLEGFDFLEKEVIAQREYSRDIKKAYSNLDLHCKKLIEDLKDLKKQNERLQDGL